MLTSITLNGVSYAFGANTVLNQIDLHIEPGSVVALLGPSGCGKSTLLRLLAGLTQPAEGAIHFGDRLVAKTGWALPPEARDIGMVFQDYALWPHMTVAQNVMFPLKMRHIPRQECDRRVAKALARVGLSEFADRKPAGLSGGQQQRVALARGYCFLTSRSPTSTANCVEPCVTRWPRCCASSVPPPSMLPTTAGRLKSWPIASCICLLAASLPIV